MKKLVKSIAFVAIAAIAGYNAYQMSEINAINNDLSLENIENVAQADEVIFNEQINFNTTGETIQRDVREINYIGVCPYYAAFVSHLKGVDCQGSSAKFCNVNLTLVTTFTYCTTF